MKWRRSLLLGLGCCGCDCEPGDYYVSVSTRDVPSEQVVSGIATIQHMDYVPPSPNATSGYPDIMTVFTIGDFGNKYHVDLPGVPPDVFPDGAQVYAVLVDGELPIPVDGEPPVPGTDSQSRRTEVTIYDHGGPSPSTLRASAWRGNALPRLEGATLEADGTACETEGGGCTNRFTRVKVTLDNGESMSVAPGEERAEGRIRMGNGPSTFETGCSYAKGDFFLGYLAVSP